MPKLLLHEYIFGLYLLVMAILLLIIEGIIALDTWVFMGLLGVNAAAILACLRKDSMLRWRLRLGFYIVAMNVAFQQMRSAVPAIRDYRADGFLETVDILIVGETPSLTLQAWIQPWISDLMSFFYFLFLPYLAISMLWYLFSELTLARRFYAGLFSLYGIGFLGYLAVPAAGPYLAMADQFSQPVAGSWITDVNAAFISAGSNGTDVFPSLHVAVSCYILLFDRRYRRWRYRIYLVPCVGLWISTIYLRYHYLIDLFAGFLLAAFSLWLAFRVHSGDDHGIPSVVR